MKFGLVCMALMAVFLGTMLTGCNRQSAPDSKRPVDQPPRLVQFEPAQIRVWPQILQVTGTLAAQERVVLSAKVAGRLETVTVDIGSNVRKGDVLATIEPRDYELRLAQAAANLAQARAMLGLPSEGNQDIVQLDEVTAVRQAQAVLDEATKSRQRIRDLQRAGIASQSELDTAEATYAVAVTRHETAREEARTRLASLGGFRAAFELAAKQLADATIRAPFNGVVQDRTAGIGEYLSPGTPVLQLVQTDPLRLKLDVPERSAALIRLGQTVHLRVEGDTNDYAGSIARISPALVERTRTLLVEADIPAQGNLRPGLFARAGIVFDPSAETLTVPDSAVIVFAGLEKVFTAKDGRAVERAVITGRRDAANIEILRGLEAGESVILTPAGLQTGQPVQDQVNPPAPQRS